MNREYQYCHSFIPIIRYGCESWTKQKTEQQRIDAFYLWSWWRLLRVSWTARRSNHYILFFPNHYILKINPEYSLEGLMLKLQYFGHLMQRTDSLKKILMLGKIEGRRRRGWTEDEMARWHHWLNGCEFEQALGDGEGQGSLACCNPWGWKAPDTTEQLNNIHSIKTYVGPMRWQTEYGNKHFPSLRGAD